MFLGNCLLIAGAITSSRSSNFGVLLGGRLLTGLGGGIAGNSA